MSVLPKTGREWFELVSLGLKVCVAFAIFAVVSYHRALSQPGMFPHHVHMEMRSFAAAVQLGCLVASSLLVATALFEVFTKHWRHAISDLAFAILALFCWSLCAGFAVKVR
jgi:hypothetical protein